MQAAQRRAQTALVALVLLAVAGVAGASIPPPEPPDALDGWPEHLPERFDLVDVEPTPQATSPVEVAAGDRFRLLEPSTLDRLLWTGRPRQPHLFVELETRVRGIGFLGWEQPQGIQWLSPEIAPGVGIGPNPYAAFLNDPINRRDPLGLESEFEFKMERRIRSEEERRKEQERLREEYLARGPSMSAVEGRPGAGFAYFVIDEASMGFFSAENGRFVPLAEATQPGADLRAFREKYGIPVKVLELLAALRNPAKGWRLFESGVAALDLLDEIGGKVRLPVEGKDGRIRMVEYDPAGTGSRWRDVETGQFVPTPALYRDVDPSTLVASTADVSDEFEQLKRAEAFREEVERSQSTASAADEFLEFGRLLLKRIRGKK